MRFFFTALLCATSLLAGLASAEFTDAEGSSMSWPDLEPTLSADKQNACIHTCSVQTASNLTTACVQKTQKSAATCLCTDELEEAAMKACFAENCPALTDRCAAMILDDGALSTFQVISFIPVKNSTSGGNDPAPSNTGDAQDTPSNTGGANGGNAPGNNGGTSGENSAVGPGRSAALALLSTAVAVVAFI
ncbi:hypothetical protein AURDEDRAFT_164913 [Auricularia subglabra TFB-10046 SS5]|nr:hypothetical protein AURDEDRAFT_164913 [Auricularia subglabra TFB-10046 SS5]